MNVTKDTYFVSVYRLGARGQFLAPNARMCVEILEVAGCEDVEYVDAGCANARIPDDWARDVEHAGGMRRQVVIGSRTWIVDIDLP
jgi:hypothetical protein